MPRYSDSIDPDSYFGTDAPPRSRSKEDDLPFISEKPAPRVFENLAAIDMDKELTDQIAEATSFRDHLLANSAAFNPKDVTDTMKTCNTLLSQAIKMRQEVQNMERMKAFEDAVITIMKTQSEKVKTQFFKLLEQELAK